MADGFGLILGNRVDSIQVKVLKITKYNTYKYLRIVLQNWRAGETNRRVLTQKLSPRQVLFCCFGNCCECVLHPEHPLV